MTHRKQTVLNVEVTPYHIKWAIRGNCRLCPVACAIAEQYLNHEVYVYNDMVEICKGNQTWIAASPPQVTRFVEEFDDGERVEPLSFQLAFTPSALTEEELPQWES